MIRKCNVCGSVVKDSANNTGGGIVCGLKIFPF